MKQAGTNNNSSVWRKFDIKKRDNVNCFIKKLYLCRLKIFK